MARNTPYQNPREELEEVGKLFQIEEELERTQFLEKTNSLPVSERIRMGTSLYPLEIQDTEFYVGDSWKIFLKPLHSLPRYHSFHPGSPISLFRDEERVFGSIQSLSESSVIVVVEGELPDWLEEGKIGIDLFYSDKTFREGKKALQKILDNKPECIFKRELLLGYKDPPFSCLSPGEEVLSLISADLNESQKKAILGILGNTDAIVLQGPPGTGKTSVLVEAIRLLVKSGKRVLVSTPTNASLDLILVKLVQLGMSPLRLGPVSRMEESCLSYTLDAMSSSHKLSRTLQKLKRESENLKKKAFRFHKNFDSGKRQEKEKARRDYFGILEAIRNTERQIEKEILALSNPILATPVSAGSSILGKEKFDVCILDEATQSLEPLAWIPILKSDTIVLAGDKNQLPPTVLSEDKKLLETLFLKAIDAFYGSKRYYFLDIQYRMDEKILGFSNQEFYENKVKTDSSIQTRKKIYLPLFSAPIVFLDTAGTGFEEEKSEKSDSIRNPGEAEFAVSILQKIQSTLEITAGEIGIISPYKEQVFAIQELLGPSSVEVSTVDSFQGREKEAILISMTRSNGSGEIGFLKDYRRMNVSLTRSKSLLVVIGDSSTLCCDPFYSRFLDYVQRMGEYRSWFEVVDDL